MKFLGFLSKQQRFEEVMKCVQSFFDEMLEEEK
jgi:hypothetical protein